MIASYTPVPPDFINMIVIVQASSDGSGNSTCGNYQISCNPPFLVVTRPDTLINFQLIAPTAGNIKFTGLTEVERSEVPQFSVPSIALNGKMMTVCDANSVTEAIAVTLDFSDNDITFKFDPQVENNPRAH